MANPEALRLLVFDRTCTGPRGLPGLSHAWRAGHHLYRGLRRLDAGFGAASWDEALAWLGSYGVPAPIAEVQFWGHGRWGQANIAGQPLDVAALAPGHPLHAPLLRVRLRMLRQREGLWWFRTCETFGTAAGHGFAQAYARFFDCRVAGHTFVIGVWQSGLHSLLPGETPTWSLGEGVRDGGPATSAAASHPRAPNTVTCLHGRVPTGF